LGISLLQLEQQQLTYLEQARILEPLKHLLPTKALVQPQEAPIETKTSVGVPVTAEG